MPVEEMYHVIKHEEKRLVSRKSKLKQTWFARRMATLASYSKALTHVLAIARAIGDGFAWFFYEGERELIAEHLKHQRQPLLPSKIGAVGERLTLKNMLVIDQKLLLYHGITTFLRNGDFSLIDLNAMKVSSIGELKTARQDSEHVQAQVSLVAAARSSLPRLPISNSPPQADRMVLPPPMAERRKRQLTVMAKAMAAATERGKEVTKATLNDFHFRDLENVVERCGHGKFEWVKAGDGFIIGAVRLSRGRKPKLSSLLLSKATDRAAHLADDAPGWAMKILRAEQRLNSLIVGSVFGDAQSFVAPRHAFPVVLWPIAPAVLADLMFSRVMVVTMLNPGHIWASIADMGFELQTDNKGRIISAKMTEGDHIVELKNLEYYTRMIAYFMMTEPSIISLIEQLISHSKEKFAGGSMMVELDPRINRFPPLRRTSSHLHKSGACKVHAQIRSSYMERVR